jgi:hypothetical protein
MKLITKEEAAAIPKRLENRNHPLRSMLMQLAKDQHLFVEKKEWTWKRKSPSTMCRRVEEDNKKLRFDCYETLDKTGWIISRVE